MERIRRARGPILFLCGLLAALPVSFTQVSFLAFFSFLPALFLLFLEWTATELPCKPRRYYGAGMWFSMGFFMMTFHWFTYMWPLDFVGLTPLGAVGVIIAACVGLPLLQSLGFAVLFYLLAWLSRTQAVRRYPLLLPLLFAAGWTVFAYTQTLTWAGVPWGAQLALSQHKNLLLVSSASFFGSYFVTFVIALVNAMLAYAILRLYRGGWRAARASALLCAGVFLLHFGLSALAYCLPTKEEKTVKAAVLQGNFSSAEKWDANTDPLTRYLELGKEAVAEGAEILVWPETAIPYDLMTDTYGVMRIRDLAKETGTTHIVGAYAYSCNEDGSYDRYNTLFLFRPDGSISEQEYHKRHLVPFGEYVPLATLIDALLPFLAELEMLDDGSRMTAGNDPALFYEDIGVIGGLVCFDSIYPSLARESVAAGAELLALGTNDSWFFDSAAVYQHNGQAVLRAIENGRCLVRAANTGVSSIISEKGEILAEIEPLVAGQTTAEVSLVTSNTLYTHIGDLFVLLAAIVFHLPFAVELILYIRKKNT